MRKVLLTLALLGLATGAWADPAVLSGGVFAAHHVEALPYSTDAPTEGWCAAYGPYAINDLSMVVNELSGGNDTWYVLAAWQDEAKTWCGTEFGFGTYDPAPFAFYEQLACFPVAGLEIPTPGWPGPNEGTAFVTTGDPWNGNWVPVYWFGGYAYDYSYGSTVIGIDIDPPTSFCGFSNCENPPMVYSVNEIGRGGMGINMAGITPQFEEIQAWACCFVEMPYCRMLEESDCLLQGGTWLGPEYTCEPVDPCPHPGACCVIGVCSIMFEEDCTLVGGEFLGPDTLCEPNPCPAVCCIQELTSPHTCEIMLEADCLAAGGFWHPEWGTCQPNPCDGYTPTDNATWGQIKSMYR